MSEKEFLNSEFRIVVKHSKATGKSLLFIRELGISQEIDTDFQAALEQLIEKKKQHYQQMADIGALAELARPEVKSPALSDAKRFLIQSLIQAGILGLVLLICVAAFSLSFRLQSERLVADISKVIYPDKKVNIGEIERFRIHLEKFKPYYREWRKFLQEEDALKKASQPTEGDQ